MPSSHSKKKEKHSPRTLTPSRQAPRCGHVGTYAWDSHLDCTSCQVWNDKGGMPVRTEQGTVNLPCVFQPFCQVCESWNSETRDCYFKAIIDRVVNPKSFKKGAKFFKLYGIPAPMELMSILGLCENQEIQNKGKDLFDSSQSFKDNVPTDSQSDDEKIPHPQTVGRGLVPVDLEGIGLETGELPPPSGGSATVSVDPAGRAASERGHSGGSLLGTVQMISDIKQLESEMFGGNSGGTSLTGALGGVYTPGGTGTRGDTGKPGNPGTHGSPREMDTMQGTGAYDYPGGVCPGDLMNQNIPGLGPGHFLAGEEVVGPEQCSNPAINYSGVDRDMIMSNASREGTSGQESLKRKHSHSVQKGKKARAWNPEKKTKDMHSPSVFQENLTGDNQATPVTGTPMVPSPVQNQLMYTKAAATATPPVHTRASLVAGSISTANTAVRGVPAVRSSHAGSIKAAVTASSTVPPAYGSPMGSVRAPGTGAPPTPLSQFILSGQTLPLTQNTSFNKDLAYMRSLTQLPAGTSIQSMPVGTQKVSLGDYKQDTHIPALVHKAKQDKMAKIARLQAKLHDLQHISDSDSSSDSDVEVKHPPSSLSQLAIENAVKDYLKQHRIKVAEDSEGEDFPSQNKTWRDFKTAIEVFTDLPETEPEMSKHRTSDMGMTRTREVLKLPMHSLLSETFNLCAESVRRNKDGEPLKVGKYLSTTRNIRKELHTLSDVPEFHKPAKEAESDSFLPSVNRKAITLSETEVKAQETQLRELALLWSQNLWGLQTLDSIMDTGDTSQQMFDHIKAVINQQKQVAPLFQDRITTLLSNVLLKRRDNTLASYNAKVLKEDTLVELRSTDFLEEKVIKIPDNIKEVESEKKSNRDLLGVLRRQTLKVTLPDNFQGQAQSKDVKATSATAAAAGTSFQVQAQTTQGTGFSGAKNYKKQNQAFRGNKGRGGRGRASYANYTRARGNYNRSNYGNYGNNGNSGNSQRYRGRGQQWGRR